MNAIPNMPLRGECLIPTANTFLRNPLEFIHEDHLRGRQICALIDGIVASDAPQADDVDQVLSFLQNELPLHLKDEEEDLFPILRKRCEPEDDIARVIRRLLSDHLHAAEDTPPVIATLKELAARPRALTDNECQMLSEFAAHSRRHLILENAVILPFARLRLTRSDLYSLCRRMCARRGLDPHGVV